MGEDVIEKIERLLRRRPRPWKRYGQLRATVATVIRRAHIINECLDISKSKMIFLGDDDFTSIALSLLFKPKEVAVIDIDKRIVDEINQISNEESLGFTVLQHDLRKPMQRSFRGKFDAFFTDPFWDIWGFMLYVTRGAQCVRKDKETLGFISFKIPWRLLTRHQTFQANNVKEAKVHFFNSFLLTRIKNVSLWRCYENVNRYERAVTSSLYVIKIYPPIKLWIRNLPCP